MESKHKALDAELQLLTLTRGKTDAVVQKGSNEKIARHREALRKIVANIEDLKLDIEKGKLAAAESIEDVKAWGEKIEQTIDEVDLQVGDLTRYLKDLGAKAENQKLEEEEAILAKKREDELLSGTGIRQISHTGIITLGSFNGPLLASFDYRFSQHTRVSRYLTQKLNTLIIFQVSQSCKSRVQCSNRSSFTY